MLRQRFLSVVVLAAGLAMLVWGGRGFSSNLTPENPLKEEPRLPLCPPSLTELAWESGLGLAAQKLGLLAVAGFGLFLSCGSALSLMPNRREA